jgi:hypothetical protein
MPIIPTNSISAANVAQEPEKLSDTAKAAMIEYYIHRKNQSIIDWDKDADLKVILDALKKGGWSFEASCGTFWLTKGKTRLYVNEGNIISGGKISYNDNSPFGISAIITAALDKRN